MKSKLIKAIIASVVVIGISVGGYFGYSTVFAEKAITASSQYITSSVRTMNLEVNVQGTGAAYAAITKEVMPNNNGIISDLTVKVGDTVTAGQKLFTSSNEDLQSAVTNAQNSVTEANINLSSVQNDLIAKQNALSVAQAAGNSASATTENNQGNQGNNQSNKSIDDYKLEVEKAKLSVEQSKLKLVNAKNNLNNAKGNLAKMTVTAPIGGIITAVNNSNGDSTQNTKPVITIVDMSSIKVKVAVDELDIEKIKLGQKVEIKFDAIKDKTYEGAIEIISQIGNNQNNVTTFDVVVGIINTEGIKLGMNANVTIKVESKENALVIPAEALVESNGKRFVRVASADSNAPIPEVQNSNTERNGEQGSSMQGNNTEGSSSRAQMRNRNMQTTNGMQGGAIAQGGNVAQSTANQGRLVEIKTEMENENYIEVIEGLTEGQKVLITLPQTNSNTTNSNKNNMSGLGGGMPTGGIPTGGRPRN